MVNYYIYITYLIERMIMHKYNYFFYINKLSFNVDFVNILNIWKFYSVHGCVSGLYVLNALGYYCDI